MGREMNLDLEAEIERQLATASEESGIPIGELRFVTKLITEATVSEVTCSEVNQVACLLVQVAQDMIATSKAEG